MAHFTGGKKFFGDAQDTIYTAAALAAALGVSVNWLRRGAGKSIPRCVDTGRVVRYLRSDVAAWLEGAKNKP